MGNLIMNEAQLRVLWINCLCGKNRYFMRPVQGIVRILAAAAVPDNEVSYIVNCFFFIYNIVLIQSIC